MVACNLAGRACLDFICVTFGGWFLRFVLVVIALASVILAFGFVGLRGELVIGFAFGWFLCFLGCRGMVLWSS